MCRGGWPISSLSFAQRATGRTAAAQYELRARALAGERLCRRGRRMSTLRLYLLYGGLVLALLGTAEYRGWSPLSPNEGKTAPRTVRDNPGSYRPHYRGGAYFFRGK